MKLCSRYLSIDIIIPTMQALHSLTFSITNLPHSTIAFCTFHCRQCKNSISLIQIASGNTSHQCKPESHVIIPIIYFWKFSKKSFNQWVCGQGIKILKNPYMGTSRDLIGRCPCGDDNFFWKLLPNLKGWRILH